MASEKPSVEELYRQAQEKYVQFDSEGAAELLKQILKRRPDHEPSRELMDEMRRDIPEPAGESSAKTDREPGSDTGSVTTGDSGSTSGENVDKTMDSPADTKPKSKPKPKKKSLSDSSPEADDDPADPVAIDTPVTTEKNAGDTADGVSSSTDSPPEVPVNKVDGEDDEAPDSPPLILPDRGEDTDSTSSRHQVSSDTESSVDSEDTSGPGGSAPPIIPNLDGTQNADTGDARAETPPVDPASPGLRGSVSGEAGPELEPPASSDNEQYSPNLNTVSETDIAGAIDESTARSVWEIRQREGYYLGWEDLSNRANLSSQQLETLRTSYSLGIPVINLNTATMEELARLPYLSQGIAREIVNFRFTYGDYGSVDGLVELPSIEESALERVKPFLEAR